MRKKSLFTLATVGVVALALTGCAAEKKDASGVVISKPECEPIVTSGSVTDDVAVEGNFNEDVNITHLPAAVPTATQARTVLQGHGKYVKDGDYVTLSVHVVNSQNGRLVYDTKSAKDGHGLQVVKAGGEKGLDAGISQALVCQKVGSRAVIALGANASEQQGIVAVVDVLDTENAQTPNGVGLPNGFPAVAIDKDGVPGFVLPPAEPPTDTEVAPYYVGDGKTIERGDAVLAQVQTVTWDKHVTSQNWEKGPVPLANLKQLNDAVVGQTVGSLVIVMQPGTSGSPATISAVKILAAK